MLEALMRVTRTWTISLPPDMSRLAQAVAAEEHRTKSELVREALRRYFGTRPQPPPSSPSRRLGQAGDLLEVYRRRHPAAAPSEAELRRTFRGVDRKSTRLNSSHSSISYAVFCLK